VTEHVWRFTASYSLRAFPGRGDSGKEDVILRAREANSQLKTVSETPQPKPGVVIIPPSELNISWLLSHITNTRTSDHKDSFGGSFSINRLGGDCHTPRRNSEVNACIDFLRQLREFSVAVSGYFRTNLFPVQKEHGFDLSVLDSDVIFVPVVPLMETKEEDEEEEEKKDKKKEKKKGKGKENGGMWFRSPPSLPFCFILIGLFLV